MTKKKVWQYKCDFCGKRGYAGGHMDTHEKHCTNNPNRACRFHKFCEDPIAPPLSEVITNLRLRGLEAAKEVASDCPCCLLAAIRQSGMGKGYVDEDGYVEPMIKYDFKAEIAEKWKDIRDAETPQ
jgi:hypothetical protein